MHILTTLKEGWLFRTRKKISSFLILLCAAGYVVSSSAQENPAPDSSALQSMLDSLGLSENDLEAKVRSTLLFGGSAPVSFSGEGRIKLQYHQYNDFPYFLRRDRSFLSSNWEGNESALRLGMVVRAGRNTVLWSKIGFQHTMPGTTTPGDTAKTGNEMVTQNHDKSNLPAIIHEDMSAGIAIRTVPASFWLKLGAVHWTEASPFTIWKAQPRTFAWEYLPYEVEQPIARYYEYNIAKGEKTGRAAWNKKPFQGINFESINLPADIYFNFLYGTFGRFDSYERETVDFSNDLSLADLSGSLKSKGIGNSYQHVIHGRLAVKELLGRLTPGLNYVQIDVENDLPRITPFKNAFSINTLSWGRNEAFYKEPKIGSFDLRGPINDKLSIHADLGIGFIDSTLVHYDSLLAYSTESTRQDFKLGVYSRIKSDYGVPVTADMIYLQKGFYSPFSFALPMDAFFPFGANMLGPGKFVGQSEGSPYTSNITGLNLVFAPKLSGYGHLRFSYGQHVQLDPGDDVIYFPYRLNGQDFFTTIQTSFNRWGNDEISVSMFADQEKRLGNESYRRNAYGLRDAPVGGEGGGLRLDYLSAFEGFVAYENAEQATRNLSVETAIMDRSATFGTPEDSTIIQTATGLDTIWISDSLYSANAWVPQHQKYTFNFDVDYGYDIGPLLGYSREIFMGLYGALNGISTSFKALAFSDEAQDMLLWGTYLRFEPAIALSNKFYLVGLAGFENWRSSKAYMYDGDYVKQVPIDYKDYAVGLGFDWDMLGRVGLHSRVKYMVHRDVNYSKNDWETPVVSTEIKMWF